MSQEEQVQEEEMVPIPKSTLEQFMTQLSNLTEKVETLTQELEESKRIQEELAQQPSIPRSQPVFHTSQRIENAKAYLDMREAEKFDRVQQSLEKATDYAIAEYKKHPPAFKQ